MAIVFISPKKNQRLFFWTITTVVVASVLFVLLLVFPPEFLNQLQYISGPVVTENPNIAINFTVLDSSQVKNLEPFLNVGKEYSYVARDRAGRQVVGKIAALDESFARTELTRLGLTITSIQETLIGRGEPFVPYYQGTNR